MSQKSSIVRFSVFVVGFLGLGLGGGGGAKIMSQKSSIVTSLVSFVSVLVVVLLHVAAVVAAVFVDVLTSSSSRSGCPCLSNGPNCRQEYTYTCALIYTLDFPSTCTYSQSMYVVPSLQHLL